ncbi:MAG: hypothetical protein R3F27_10905 [Gammaproteobacteria bacterium]
MRLLKNLLIGLAGLAVVAGVGGYATYKYMNRTPAQLVAPNYYEYYLNQDTVPEGRVGIFISSLIMPEDYRIEDYFLLALKARQYIPWPVNLGWIADRGVLLLDPAALRVRAICTGTPGRCWGRDTDLDGLPYADKLHTGDRVGAAQSAPASRSRLLPAEDTPGRHAHGVREARDQGAHLLPRHRHQGHKIRTRPACARSSSRRCRKSRTVTGPSSGAG